MPELAIVVVLDVLQHLPCLVIAQVGAVRLHVLDAPDDGDFATLGKHRLDVDIAHDRGNADARRLGDGGQGLLKVTLTKVC